MKIEQKKYKFNPVIITLETQEEVDIIFNILNFYPLSAIFAGTFIDELWEDLLHIDSNDDSWFKKIEEKLEVKEQWNS